MTTKRWIWIVVAIAMVCIVMIACMMFTDHGSTVTITQDGSVLYTIDLSKVEEPYELTVSYGEHYNIIAVEPGQIYVREADCSNQVCVDHGILQQAGAPITCLPHHLIIHWAGSGVDA